MTLLFLEDFNSSDELELCLLDTLFLVVVSFCLFVAVRSELLLLASDLTVGLTNSFDCFDATPT